jgi:protein-disulfide isomerase
MPPGPPASRPYYGPYPPAQQFPPGYPVPPGHPVGPGYPAGPSKGSRTWIVAVAAFGILAIIVIVGVVAVLGRDGGSGGTEVGVAAPGAGSADVRATRQPDGSIALGQPGIDHPVLEIYEDFQCPVCKSFESANGATVKQLVTDGKVQVVYRPFRLFDQEPLSSNSRRAAAAALCAPAGNWVAFHDLLFQHQPPEGQEGFAAADLVTWGKQAGIDDPAFATCVTGQQKAGQVEQATQAALAAGVQGTPTLKLDGTTLPQSEVFTPDGLRQAVLGSEPDPVPTV